MGGWGCPHELNDRCQKVLGRPCDIGMKGCVLAGRFNFADPGKNRPKKKPLDEANASAPTSDRDA